MPFSASNSWWLPISRISPLCKTMILSALWIVERRCAITIDVRPWSIFLIACWINCFGFGINAGCRFIPVQESADWTQARAQGEQLFLSDREGGASFLYFCSIGIRQRINKPICAHQTAAAFTRSRGIVSSPRWNVVSEYRLKIKIHLAATTAICLRRSFGSTCWILIPSIKISPCCIS